MLSSFHWFKKKLFGALSAHGFISPEWMRHSVQQTPIQIVIYAVFHSPGRIVKMEYNNFGVPHRNNFRQRLLWCRNGGRPGPGGEGALRSPTWHWGCAAASGAPVLVAKQPLQRSTHRRECVVVWIPAARRHANSHHVAARFLFFLPVFSCRLSPMFVQRLKETCCGNVVSQPRLWDGIYQTNILLRWRRKEINDKCAINRWVRATIPTHDTHCQEILI